MKEREPAPPHGQLELELLGILALVVVVGVLAWRAERTLARARVQLRGERNRRIEAEDAAGARERAVDGALDHITTLRGDYDRIATRLAELEGRPRPGPAPDPEQLADPDPGGGADRDTVE